MQQQQQQQQHPLIASTATNNYVNTQTLSCNIAKTSPHTPPTSNHSTLTRSHSNHLVNTIQLQQQQQQPPPLPPTNEQQEALALKKALEWELGLDAKDLRSHAWYHGPLPRQRAEEIVKNIGDFLIRDCASQPDNYVLTCCPKASSVLHFVINKVLVQPETVYERVQYQFEEDSFDTIPDLITFYVGSGRQISAASGARIKHPCNRTYPLSFYGHKIVGNQLHMQMLTGARCASPLNSPLSCNVDFRFGGSSPQLQQQQQQAQLQCHSPLASPPRCKFDLPPRLPSKKQRSQSLTPTQAMLVSNAIRNSDLCCSNETLMQRSSGSDCFNGSISNSNTNSLSHNSGGGGVCFKEVPRFSHLEKCNSIGAAPSDAQVRSHIERLAQQNKIHHNGLQTIGRCNAGGDFVNDSIKFTTHSLPRPNTTVAAGNAFHRGSLSGSGRFSSLTRNFSTESRIAQQQIPELPEQPPSPPPKPQRAPNLIIRDKEFYVQQQHEALQRAAAAAAAVGIFSANSSDSGNGSGDSVHSSLACDMSELSLTPNRVGGVIIRKPTFMSQSSSTSTLTELSEFDADAVEAQLLTMDLPEFKPVTKFDVENFNTLLLPALENKPLDEDALNTFKMMLLENCPRSVAEHLTRIDIGLLIDEIPENDDDDEENIFLNCCGLEMLTLPHGKVFRNDLIERTQCIKLLVAVTILTCQTDMERAAILSQWIQVAVETKTALGNLFGFAAVMLGLCMPQIDKLDIAWHILRQKYTDSAFTFEAKLRPTLHSMNDGTNPQAPNTTVPHVVVYALLKDRPVIDIINSTMTKVNPTLNTKINNDGSNAIQDEDDDKCSLYDSCVTPWEKKSADFGLTITYDHMDSVRGYLNSLDLYRRNAKTIIEDSRPRLDELLSDAFRTEFHIKFLWGSAGATATPEERHSKLEKVLRLMAEKFCYVENDTATEVATNGEDITVINANSNANSNLNPNGNAIENVNENINATENVNPNASENVNPNASENVNTNLTATENANA